jgi:hypothetical protein
MPITLNSVDATHDLIEHLDQTRDSRGLALLARVMLADVHEVRNAADDLLEKYLVPPRLPVPAGDDDAVSPSSSPGGTPAPAGEPASLREPANAEPQPEAPGPLEPDVRGDDEPDAPAGDAGASGPILEADVTAPKGYAATVLQWLTENPGSHAPRAIAAGTGIKPGTVSDVLGKLRRAGDIDATGTTRDREYAIAGRAEIPDELDDDPELAAPSARDVTTFGKGRELRRGAPTSVDPADPVARARMLDAQIRDVLEDGKPRTAQELAREMFRNFQEVHLRLQAGAAQRADGGLWTLADDREPAHA